MRRLQYQWIIFALIAVFVHLFYYRTWNAGFVTDFTGLQWRLEGAPWWAFLNCFGFPAMQQLLHLLLYIFYNTFGVNGLPWYLLFTSLHIINASLLFRLIQNFSKRIGMRSPEMMAGMAALCFALSPYHTEVLVWRVCLNFLLSGFFILMTMQAALRWFDEGRQRHLWWAHGFFISALFTFELGLILPALSTLMIAVIPAASTDVRRRFLLLPGLQWTLTAGYFLLNKIVLGSWVGHYGEAVHLRFPLLEMAGNFWRYVAKLVLFGRYLDLPVKQAVFGKLDQPGLIAGLSTALATFLVWSLLLYKRQPMKWRLAGFFLMSFVIALSPVLNLYFNNLMRIDGDRYAYVPSLFFFAFAVLVVSALPRIAAGLAAVLFLALSMNYLAKTNERWVQSTKLYYSLLDDYRWQEKEHVFVLNLPDNYQGAPIFRDHSMQNRGLADALHYIRRKTPSGKIYEVAQYNLAAPDDGVGVQLVSEGVYEVQFLQTGNWWWRGGIGATAYTKPEYRFEPGEGRYLLYLDSIPPGAIFVFQKGGSWREVGGLKSLTN